MHITSVALHEVTWCMVVCTQNAPRRQQFHVAPAIVDLQKRAIEKLVTNVDIELHANAVRLLESGEQCYV